MLYRYHTFCVLKFNNRLRCKKCISINSIANWLKSTILKLFDSKGEKNRLLRSKFKLRIYNFYVYEYCVLWALINYIKSTKLAKFYSKLKSWIALFNHKSILFDLWLILFILQFMIYLKTRIYWWFKCNFNRSFKELYIFPYQIFLTF